MENFTPTSTLAEPTGGLLSGQGDLQVIGSVNYPTVAPKRYMSVQQAFAEKEKRDQELRRNPPSKIMTPTQEQLLTQAIASAEGERKESTQAEVSKETKETVQKFSAWDASLGTIPSGYEIGRSCASCEYYEGCLSEHGRCYKYDINCVSYYVCDSYEKQKSYLESESYLWDDSVSAYAMPLDLGKATDEQLVLLSDVAESSDIVDIDQGLLLIKDEAGSKIAVQVLSMAKNEKDKASILAIASKFTAKPNLESSKQPSKPILFKLAQSKSGSVYSNYEQLYTAKFGSLEGCYIDEVKSDTTVTTEESKLDLVKLAEQYPGLYQIATERFAKSENDMTLDELFKDILVNRKKI